MKSFFVSSTFRDMQAERDVLMLKVLPEINEFAEKFGESIKFLDLRWGVNTAETKKNEVNKKVLTVCLDEIEKTRPYMIVFLGERYGWMPGAVHIKRVADEKKHPLDDADKSVTELEIQFGAFSEKAQPDRCLFYMREPLDRDKVPENLQGVYFDDEEVKNEKLHVLKQKILASGAKVKSYSCEWDSKNMTHIIPENFADTVINDLKEMFGEEFKKAQNLSWQEKEELISGVFLNQKAELFSARQKILDECQKLIDEKDNQLFILSGKSGTGKSTLMAKLAKVLKESCEVLFIVCGSGQSSHDLQDILKQIIFKLESLLGIEERFEQKAVSSSEDILNIVDYIEKFASLALEYAAFTDKPLYIFCDALDKLSTEYSLNNYMEDYAWIPLRLPENVTLVLSQSDTMTIPELTLTNPQCCVYNLNELENDERGEVVRGILSAGGKELKSSLVNAIARTPQAKNPMYLEMMLQRLIMFDSEDFREIEKIGLDDKSIDRYLGEVIKSSPRSIEGISCNTVMEAAKRINPGQSQIAIDLIAVSRKGLRESDLEAIFEKRGLQWNPLDFSLLTKYLKPFLHIRHDGRINFAHEAVREGIVKDLDILDYNIWILRHFHALGHTDKVAEKEIVYHAWIEKNYEMLTDFIFKAITDRNEALDDFIELVASDNENISKHIMSQFNTAKTSGLGGYFLTQELRAILAQDNLFAMGFFEYIANIEDEYKFYTLSRYKLRMLASFSEEVLGESHAYEMITKGLARLESLVGEDILFGRLQSFENASDANYKRRINYARGLAGHYFGIAENTDKFPDRTISAMYYNKALDLMEILITKHGVQELEENRLECLMHLGNLYSRSEDKAKGLDYYIRAMEAAKKLRENLSTTKAQELFADTALNLAWFYNKINEPEKALESCELTRDTIMKLNEYSDNMWHRSLQGKFYSRLAISYENTYFKKKTSEDKDDNKEAPLYADKALKAYEKQKQLGKKMYETYRNTKMYIDYLYVDYIVSGLYSAMGEHQKAVELITDFFDSLKNIPNTQKQSYFYEMIGKALETLSRSYAIMKDYDKIYEIYEKIGENAANEGQDADFYAELGWKYAVLGNTYYENAKTSGSEKEKEYAIRAMKKATEIIKKASLAKPDIDKFERTMSVYEIVSEFHMTFNYPYEEMMLHIEETLDVLKRIAARLKVPELDEKVAKKYEDYGGAKEHYALNLAQSDADKEQNFIKAKEAYKVACTHRDRIVKKIKNRTTYKELGICYSRYADMHLHLGDKEGNIKYADECIEAFISAYKKETSEDAVYDIYIAYNKKGNACTHLNMTDEAIDAYERAKGVLEDLLRQREHEKFRSDLLQVKEKINALKPKPKEPLVVEKRVKFEHMQKYFSRDIEQYLDIAVFQDTFEIRLNQQGEVLFEINYTEGKDYSAPIMFYDGGAHAVLFKGRDEMIVFHEIHPEIRPYLLAENKVYCVEIKTGQRFIAEKSYAPKTTEIVEQMMYIILKLSEELEDEEIE